MKNTLVKNTLILIITSLIIRVLSLVNRIVLTRLLGNEGISLYVISLPSIMLFMSIAAFSLNTSLSKIISENEVTKKYSNKTIITKAILIGMFTTIVTSIVLLLIIKPLTSLGLKQDEAYYPILASIVFLPLVTINGVYRGYFNGIRKINITAVANLIEQVSRIIVGIVFLYIFSSFGVVIAVTMAILAMGVGELISLIFIIIKYRKAKLNLEKNNNNPSKLIISTAIPITSSRLIGNLTEFLEPIIYTAALSLIGFSSSEILFKYSTVTAYAIPLITLSSFISQSIAVAIIPNISSAKARDDKPRVNFYIKKALMYSFIPGILVTILLSTYGREYMMFIYAIDIGADYVTKLSIFFSFYYLLSPLWAIMQAIGKSSFLFWFNIISSILKLALIFSLSFIPWINYHSLIISLLINIILTFLVLYFYLKNTFAFKFGTSLIFKIITLILLTYLSLIILKAGIKNYLLVTIILSLLFFIYLKLLKLTSLNDE